MRRLGVYDERVEKYLGLFREYVSGVGIVVDVGCGTGAFSKALTYRNRFVIALDISEGALRKIRDSRVEGVCADAHRLPFRDSSVDCALSLSLLEHLENPGKCIEELFRVLKRGGKAVVQLPNLQYLFEPHTKWPLLYLLPKGVQLRIFRMIDYSYVNMAVTIKYVISVLQKVGFKLKETVKVYHLNIMRLLPLAPAYIFIAEKCHLNMK